MRLISPKSGFWVVCALLAVSSFAQNSPLVGTVIDIDEGRNRIQVEDDARPGSRISVETDALSTTWYGFGTEIAGKAEVFTGSAGMANVRLGDRLSIRGTTRAQGAFHADRITLLGRQVAAGQVGVGQTRPPASVSTPTTDQDISRSPAAELEGTIRQINLQEGRIVIQTAQRRLITVRTSRNTPVTYRNETYRVSNLEVGDRIRVETDSRNANAGEVFARTIDVTASVQDVGTGSGGSVTVLAGRVTRVEPTLDRIYVDDGPSGEVRVDMRQAMDANREVIRARDIQVGDEIEISGSYNRAGDMFLASTVRFDADSPLRASDIGYRLDEKVTQVTFTGTVTETLEDSSTLGFRDVDTNRVERIWVTETFVVRTKSGSYIRAEALRVNDSAIIEAFRDVAGNLIAQTIRLRNR